MKKAASLSMAALMLAPVITLTAVETVRPTMAFAQAAPVQAGSVSGSIQNPAGQAVKEGEVKLSTDRSTQDDKTRKYQYTFPVSADGTYKATDVAPGDYVLFYQVGGKTIDYQDHVVVKAGDNLTVNLDMTREEYLKNLTPEQRKQIEEFKKQNAAATSANKTIGNLNALLTKARAEEKSGDYATAVTDMQQATTQKPDEAILWLELGNSQVGEAKTEKDAAKKTQLLADAQTSYQKAIDTNAASKKPNPIFVGAAYNGLGEAYGRGGKPKEASDAYDKAAGAEPSKAGMYYFNEAVTLSNAGSDDAAAAAADKAIAADPTKADAYYIKGKSLIGKSTVDPKSQKIVPPPGCAEAYQKYLDLDPNGKFAPEVKQIMQGFDEKVTSSFKAGKKR